MVNPIPKKLTEDKSNPAQITSGKSNSEKYLQVNQNSAQITFTQIQLQTN
jgi:hypothetical protein